MQHRTSSAEIFRRSCQVLPGGVNSPVRAFSEVSISPLVVESGRGDRIWDVDGHSYIDYCGSWGALILGHTHPDIMGAVQHQLKKGSTFGIATAVEEQLATLLIKLIPSLDKVRFVSSGTEAVMSAVRLARGATGKPFIVKFAGNYHGHSDGLLVKAGSGVSQLTQSSSKGVLEDIAKYTLCISYNDLEGCQNLLRSRRDIAAVLVEPIAGNMGVVPPAQGFLEMLREETKKNGALLIFDEVITGFRVGLRGAQGLYSIDPDLTCLGKVIGGGFPAAAFGGKSIWMDELAPLGGVYQAGTLSGNPVAMVAGSATLQHAMQEGFYEILQAKIDRLAAPIEGFLRKSNLPVCLQRVGSMMTLFFGVRQVRNHEDLGSLDREAFSRFFRFLFERGIYIPPSQHEAWFISMAHTEEHLDKTNRVILEFLSTFT